MIKDHPLKKFRRSKVEIDGPIVLLLNYIDSTLTFILRLVNSDHQRSLSDEWPAIVIYQNYSFQLTSFSHPPPPPPPWTLLGNRVEFEICFRRILNSFLRNSNIWLPYLSLSDIKSSWVIEYVAEKEIEKKLPTYLKEVCRRCLSHG